MTDFTLNKLVIIGVGLIGGSFALALRKAGMVKFIVGMGRNKENMQHALNLGVIDKISDDLVSAMQDADFVLLAMPVGQTTQIMAKIAPHLEAKTILTDVGSTKQDVIAAARSYLTDNLRNFVPGHPIAGAELSGVGAARADLFRDKHLILTPLAETTAHAINQVVKCWQSCGAQISQMHADEHDKVLAATSHLPHILAFTLMNYLRNSNEKKPDNLLRFAGSGFRDFTRIASSSPEMWRDICLANREALLTQIDAYKNALTSLQKDLANGNAQALEKTFTDAREIRANWLKDKT
jgi:prephenate dehydrogenase